jgi:beta-aspartyl-peptidase (threonine type)
MTAAVKACAQTAKRRIFNEASITEAAADYSLMVHGGAVALDNANSDKEAVRCLESIRQVLEHGRGILTNGGNALEAVEQCASLLRHYSLFNAGAGAVLNEDGKVELDAAIVCGANLQAGAVACVSNIANPIQLARVLQAESEHVILIASMAQRFADHWGFKRVPNHYFFTPDRMAQWEDDHRLNRIGLDHDSEPASANVIDQKHGTMGAVAHCRRRRLCRQRDMRGFLHRIRRGFHPYRAGQDTGRPDRLQRSECR